MDQIGRLAMRGWALALLYRGQARAARRALAAARAGASGRTAAALLALQPVSIALVRVPGPRV